MKPGGITLTLLLQALLHVLGRVLGDFSMVVRRSGAVCTIELTEGDATAPTLVTKLNTAAPPASAEAEQLPIPGTESSTPSTAAPSAPGVATPRRRAGRRRARRRRGGDRPGVRLVQRRARAAAAPTHARRPRRPLADGDAVTAPDDITALVAPTVARAAEALAARAMSPTHAMLSAVTEAAILTWALTCTDGRVGVAAALLGMPERTLRYRMRARGIRMMPFRVAARARRLARPTTAEQGAAS